MTADPPRAVPRVTTGVHGLDELLGGGLLAGGVYLVSGQPGAGKTLLSSQVVFHHIAQGGRALYVTLLAESHARLIMLLEQMSFFNPDAVGDSLRYLSGYQVLEKEKLGGLSRLLRGAIRDHRASLLVIDGLLTAQDLVETDLEMKRFVHDLQILAEVSGCTTLMLRGAHDPDEAYPERTMADGLLRLTAYRVGVRTVREIEVEKHRGSDQRMGGSFYEISRDGLAIYPRAETRFGIRTGQVDRGPGDPVGTGLAELDAMLHGGLPRGSTTMLLGSPGSGKTILSLQFLAAGARDGEPGLYLGFSETPARLLGKAHGIGLELAPLIERGALELQWSSGQEILADGLAERLFTAIAARGVRRLVIDGFEALTAGLIYPERLRVFATAICNELRARGVTVVLAEELTAIFSPDLILPRGASEIADNLLLLRHVELRSRRYGLLSILKMRDHPHERIVRELEISSRGVRISDTFEPAEAVLTGTARSPGCGSAAARRSATSPGRRRFRR